MINGAPVVHVFSWSGTCTNRSIAKNLHPTVPETGFKIDPRHVDGYAFFSSVLYSVRSHRGISKGPKF